MSLLIWLIANIVMIVFIILAIKEKDPIAKKKKRLVWIGSLAVGFIMFIIIGSSGSKENKPNSEQEAPVVQADTNTEEDSIQESETIEVSEETTDTTEGLSAEMVAGELGEYGQELVLNKGTEFEDTTIGYFVPAGKYEVTNIGEKMTQVNVYKNEKNTTDEGWEEWADAKVELIDVGASKEMTVEDGYFFNIDPPAHISIKLLEGSAASSESDTEANKAFISEHDSDIIAAAKLALDNFIDGYDLSLAPQKWTIAKFDETETTVIAMTDITYKGEKGKYIYVGTLNINSSGTVESAKPHYLEVNGEVLGDDGYAKDVFDKINSIGK